MAGFTCYRCGWVCRDHEDFENNHNPNCPGYRTKVQTMSHLPSDAPQKTENERSKEWADNMLRKIRSGEVKPFQIETGADAPQEGGEVPRCPPGLQPDAFPPDVLDEMDALAAKGIGVRTRELRPCNHVEPPQPAPASGDVDRCPKCGCQNVIWRTFQHGVAGCQENECLGCSHRWDDGTQKMSDIQRANALLVELLLGSTHTVPLGVGDGWVEKRWSKEEIQDALKKGAGT